MIFQCMSAKCSEIIAYHSLKGYTNSGSSQECVDVDECKSGRPPCSVNPLVSCVNTPGSFRCGNCPEGENTR